LDTELFFYGAMQAYAVQVSFFIKHKNESEYVNKNWRIMKVKIRAKFLL